MVTEPGSLSIFLVGDSTMSDKPLDPPQPERGWGQFLHEYFPASVIVRNHAMDGRSSKSFIDEFRWAAVRQLLKPGDYVIIQFGHNDQKIEDPTRFTEPRKGYRENLSTFVREARNQGAVPILATPVCRRSFDEAGQFSPSHGDYPRAVREVAEERNVPLLELHDLTQDLIRALGLERSKELFLWIGPNIYPSLPAGREDDTHFSAFGARKICELAVREFSRLHLPLVRFLKETTEAKSQMKRGFSHPQTS